MVKLDDKVAVVTGAAQGVGKTIASTLAEMGAKVFLLDKDESQLEQAIKELRAENLDVHHHVADLASPTIIEEAAQKICGSHSVDILVNTVHGVEMKAELESGNNSFAICCREFGKYLKDRNEGSIVNVAAQDAAETDFDVAKRMAGELFQNHVRINQVFYGDIQNDSDDKYALQDWHVASMTTFLASEAARGITGQSITVDCGQGVQQAAAV